MVSRVSIVTVRPMHNMQNHQGELPHVYVAACHGPDHIRYTETSRTPSASRQKERSGFSDISTMIGNVRTAPVTRIAVASAGSFEFRTDPEKGGSGGKIARLIC